MNHRNWLLIAAMIAGLAALTAQSPWQAILVNPATGIADRSNITFYGVVSGGVFVGSGAGLSNLPVAGFSPTQNVLVVTGRAEFALAAGNGAGLTNLVPTRWAVFSIPMGEPWWDVHLKASTNGFLGEEPCGKVFAYSTSDPDGSTAWAIIPPGTLPWSFGQDEATWMNTGYGMVLARPGLLNRGSPNGFWDDAAYWGDWTRMHAVWIMVPAGGAVHPTNRLFWAYLRAGSVDVERYAAGGNKWTPVVPMWVDYDPRFHTDEINH